MRDLEAEAFDQMGIQDLGQKILTKQKKKKNSERQNQTQRVRGRERERGFFIFMGLCIVV